MVLPSMVYMKVRLDSGLAELKWHDFMFRLWLAGLVRMLARCSVPGCELQMTLTDG